MQQPQNNSYEILILPIDYGKSFLEYSKREVKDYFQWFLKIKSIRLRQLCTFLFMDKENCLQEKKINVVEFFLLNSINKYDKPKEQFDFELSKIPVQLKPYAKPGDYILDTKTISICYDIGIFLGDLIISLDNEIQWKLQTNVNYADYGQPVLVKRGMKIELNPFRVVKNIAATVIEGRYNEHEIISVFNTWKKLYKVDN